MSIKFCAGMYDFCHYLFFVGLDEIVLLFNCSTGCREFMDQEKGKQSQTANLKDANIEMLINQHFADWLEQKVHFIMIQDNVLA
jgi:hypothetical protein